MNKQSINNNMVIIAGEIITDFKYYNMVFGESFYSAKIKSLRNSGNYDLIPILISEHLLDRDRLKTGSMVVIKGQFQSYNRVIEGKRSLDLILLVKELMSTDDVEDQRINSIYLDGYLCKKATFRITPKGRKITDFMLAVNRPYGHADYIPCICWNQTALFVSRLTVGSHFRIHGRIQSRDYQKKVNEEDIIMKTAYEVSVCALERVVEEVDYGEKVADSKSFTVRQKGAMG